MTSKLLQVLFVGGTGTISASCARSAVARGMDVTAVSYTHLDKLTPESLMAYTWVFRPI